jgi:wyosine [tRNA(Phe)-imidazoG37] synthetase (radical SAM superfamily)
MIAFGPVPSRRLGSSLGINNIFPKVCTYSCIYCQLGRTLQMEVHRRPFFSPERISREVTEKAHAAQAAGLPMDYLTFVPDGEPTLDLNLGEEIEMLKPLGYRIAVISNASLIWDEGVKEDLEGADYISLKVDSVDERVWQSINRPAGGLALKSILEGIMEFSQRFRGYLATETMLVRGANDDERSLRQTAEFLSRAGPDRAYISVPIRPPAERWAVAPAEEDLNAAYQIFSQRLADVELLARHEGDLFASTGDVQRDLLAITAVHPMREEAVMRLLASGGADWDVVRQMLEKGLLKEMVYLGKKFYARRL